MSVDALRGFDMFWIIGAGSLARAIQRMDDNRATRFVSEQLQHVQWVGLRFNDLIFPLFLFLMGVSLPFSLDKLIARSGMLAALVRIVRRSLLLYALGVFCTGGLTDRWPEVQLGGVLQRIAACYLAAALLYCALRARALAAAAVVLLVGYWGLLAYVPFPDLHLDRPAVAALAKTIGSDSPAKLAAAVPGRVHGSYDEGYNLTNYVDFRLLPGKKPRGYYINEGLLSTLPAIALPLLGALAGLLLGSGRIPARRKVGWLLAAGVVGVLVGLAWSVELPIIKRIWTSSFVLVAAGYSAIVLGLFYLVVDVWKLRAWCQPLVWLGMNSITIYLAVNIVSFPRVAERLAGGDIRYLLNAQMAGLGDLVVAVLSLGLAVALVGFLHRKKIFLRV